MDRTRALAATLATGLLTLVAVTGAGTTAHAEDGSAVPAGVVDLPGEEVEQSADPDDPTPVTAGAWRGELGPFEDAEGERWFEYRRVTDESSLLVSVISPGADPAVADAVELEVQNPEGESCVVSSATDSRSDDDAVLLGTEVAIGVQEAALGEDERGFECLNENRLLIRVARGSNGEAGDAPYAMRVVEESPLDPEAELPEALERLEAQAPDVDSEREDLAGGSGLEDAPEVTDGRYRGSVATDRTVVYRVPDVGWGQTLKTALSVDPVDLADDVFSGPEVSLRVLTPMWTSTATSGADGESLSGEESVQAVASAGPVRYLNRRDDVGSETPTYLPGDHYVLVTVEPPDEGPALDVDYTLEVAVDGAVEDAPAFTDPDAYLVAEGEQEPTITAVGAGGPLAVLGTAGRYAGVAVLALAGAVALVAGVRTLRV